MNSGRKARFRVSSFLKASAQQCQQLRQKIKPAKLSHLLASLHLFIHNGPSSHSLLPESPNTLCFSAQQSWTPEEAPVLESRLRKHFLVSTPVPVVLTCCQLHKRQKSKLSSVCVCSVKGEINLNCTHYLFGLFFPQRAGTLNTQKRHLNGRAEFGLSAA